MLGSYSMGCEKIIKWIAMKRSMGVHNTLNVSSIISVN